MAELSKSVWSATSVLILVMDPFGNIPLFLSLLKNIEQKRRPVDIIDFSILKKEFHVLNNRR